MAPVFLFGLILPGIQGAAVKDIHFRAFGSEHSDVVDVERSADDSPRCKAGRLKAFSAPVRLKPPPPPVTHWKRSERDTGERTVSCIERGLFPKDFRPLSVTLLDGQMCEGKEIS